VYAIALGNGFAYDDVAIIGGDPRVHTFALGDIFTKGYWADEGHALYRPLTTLSFALDWSVAPNGTAWFHLTNVVLHAGASALVALLIARFWTPAGALLGGVLFAVHPVHVEAVANVVGRAELLAAVCFLGGCLVWLAAHDDARAGFRRTIVPVLFALAVFSKESAVMMPAVLPLLDLASGELRARGLRDYIRRNALAYALLALVAAGYVVARAAVLGEAGGPERLDPSLEVIDSARDRILTALQAWPVWLRLLLLPVTLLADYGPRILAPIQAYDRDVLLGAVILLAAVGGGVAAMRRGADRTALALLWFPVTILPVSNLFFPIGVIVAERTLYLPAVALSFGAAALLLRWPALPPLRQRLAAAALAAVLAVFAVRSIVRVPEWDSTDRIMLALVRDRPDAFRGQWHMARMARAAGDDQGALRSYGEALELWPHRQRMVFEAIGFAAEVRRLDYAAELAGYAARRWPESADAHRFLVATTLDAGDTAAARRYLREGLRVAPADEAMLRMRDAIGIDSSVEGSR
jgi:tetratricopeptide (TPR) repeat protein